jgi:peroxiredoxin
MRPSTSGVRTADGGVPRRVPRIGGKPRKGAAVRTSVAILIGVGVCLCTSGAAVRAQTPTLAPVTVGSPMPDFTLPTYQGGWVTLSALKGKTVILIFLRGYAGLNAWCHVCNYQYSELVDYEATHQFRKQANVEILFVMPYAKLVLDDWIDKYPQQLADLEAYKNPPDPSKLDQAGRQRMERSRRVYPKTFRATKGQVPIPFPILMDAERTVSKGLGLFTTEWSGSKAEQNVPTTFIIDPTGVVQFKYLSQNTIDRPFVEYLVKVVGWINGSTGRPAR